MKISNFSPPGLKLNSVRHSPALVRKMYATAQHHGYMSHTNTTEDFFNVTPLDNTTMLYSLFDGHKGPTVSREAAKKLPQSIKARFATLEDRSPTNLERVLMSEFHEFDLTLKRWIDCGSTATCAIVTPTHIIVANIGDTPALVFSTFAELLHETEIHDCYNPEEAARIEAAGGFISDKNRSKTHCVNNDVAVTRAFGDFQLKQQPLLLSIPKTYVWDRKAGTYLALCTSGFTETLCNDPSGTRDRDGSILKLIQPIVDMKTIVRELVPYILMAPDLKTAAERATIARAEAFYYTIAKRYCGENTTLILVAL